MTSELSLPHQPLPGSLVLTLMEAPGEHVRVRAVELLGDGSRLRVSFTRDNALDAVFDESALDPIRDILNRAPAGNGMVMLPDLLVRLKDLALGHARLIAAEDPDGARQFSIRFERVFGNLMSLFSETVDVADALSAQTRSLAKIAHQTVYLPLFDFAEFLENAHDSSLYGDRQRLYKHLSETRDRIRELEQYYGALMDLVEDDSDALEAMPPPGTILQ